MATSCVPYGGTQTICFMRYAVGLFLLHHSHYAIGAIGNDLVKLFKSRWRR